MKWVVLFGYATSVGMFSIIMLLFYTALFLGNMRCCIDINMFNEAYIEAAVLPVAYVLAWKGLIEIWKKEV